MATPALAGLALAGFMATALATGGTLVLAALSEEHATPPPSAANIITGHSRGDVSCYIVPPGSAGAFAALGVQPGPRTPVVEFVPRPSSSRAPRGDFWFLIEAPDAAAATEFARHLVPLGARARFVHVGADFGAGDDRVIPSV